MVLDNVLDEITKKIPHHAVVEVIARKLKQRGITLTKRERSKLTNDLIARRPIRITRPGKRNGSQILDFDDTDWQQVRSVIDNILEKVPDIIDKSSDQLAKSMLPDLKKRWPKERKELDREITGFRVRLNDRWGEAIDRLRMLVRIAFDFGNEVTTHLRSREEVNGRPHLVDVLTRTHARACRLAAEVVCLLESGFADGANARWRTLHEISVTAMLLSKHGEPLARRYVFHQNVEAMRAARDYQKCCNRLGYKPLSDREVERIARAKDAAIAEFGDDFGKSQYGWAVGYVRGAPTMTAVEEAAGLDHLRSHYRMASHSVHAHARGLFFQLGLMRESQTLLAGASNAGLADPGDETALSLLQVSAALGSISPTLTSITTMKVMQLLHKEVSILFLRAHRKLEKDEKSLQSEERKMVRLANLKLRGLAKNPATRG